MGQVFGIIDQDSDITIEYPLGGIDRNGPQSSMRIFGDQFGNFVDDITVPLPLRMQENENVKKYVGKPIVYGIRCEDMHINSSYALENKQNEITLKADLAEMMGSEVYIYSSINDKEIIAKVRSDTNISSGDSVKLYIDTEKVHLFDPESELLICD